MFFQPLPHEILKLAVILDILYERTIDFGGHPNAYSVLTNMMIDKGKEIVDFKLLYLNLNAGGEQQGLSMKTLGQVGITCLYVFKHVWKHRFDIIGLSDRIEQEKSDLKEGLHIKSGAL